MMMHVLYDRDAWLFTHRILFWLNAFFFVVLGRIFHAYIKEWKKPGTLSLVSAD